MFALKGTSKAPSRHNVPTSPALTNRLTWRVCLSILALQAVVLVAIWGNRTHPAPGTCRLPRSNGVLSNVPTFSLVSKKIQG
jgi:hypothetical protein